MVIRRGGFVAWAALIALAWSLVSAPVAGSTMAASGPTVHARLSHRLGSQRTLESLLAGRAERVDLQHVTKSGGWAEKSRPEAARRVHESRCAGAPAFGWFHTAGAWIEDKNGCRVRLAGVDWFGMETTNFVPDGLNFLPYATILTEIKAAGFNTIRLSISEEMVRFSKRLVPDPTTIRANPELATLHPLQILDRIVGAARRIGIFVILDNHGSLAGSKRTSHIEATWTYYTEKGWIHDWLTLVRRYRHDPTVIGMDIRNEPHTAGPGPWTLKTYLTQGATWGRYPSKLWNPASDWQAAATKCGNAILNVNRHLLIFVEGVQLYPDRTQPHGVETYWWGAILRGVARHPVVLDVPHQLVYSPHEWGPRRTVLSQFSYRTTYDTLAQTFYENWAFILHSKNRRVQAPIWLGEFGTCNLNNACVIGAQHGSQGQWFQILVQYLRSNPEIGWAYFPVNGTNSKDEWSNNSIFDRSWTHVKLPLLVQTLETIMGQPSQ